MDQGKRHIGSMNLMKYVQGWIKEKEWTDQWIYSKNCRGGSKKKTSELVGKKTRSMINEFTAVASCTVVMMSQ